MFDKRITLVTLSRAYHESYIDDTEIVIVQVHNGDQKVDEWQFIYDVSENVNEFGAIEYPTYPAPFYCYISFLRTHNIEFTNEGQLLSFAPAYQYNGYDMGRSEAKNPKTATEVFELREPRFPNPLPFSALFKNSLYELYRLRINPAVSGEGRVRASRLRQFRFRALPPEFELDLDDRVLIGADTKTLRGVIGEGSVFNILQIPEYRSGYPATYSTVLPKTIFL